jgi:hypothetical protein
MPQTARLYWGAHQGRVRINVNWDQINHDSVVLVTVAEYQPQDPPTDDYRKFGDVPITVENIVPHGPPYDPNHGVTFNVNIDVTDYSIYIATDITLLDNPPFYVGYPSAMTPLSSSTTAEIQTAPSSSAPS